MNRRAWCPADGGAFRKPPRAVFDAAQGGLPLARPGRACWLSAFTIVKGFRDKAVTAKFGGTCSCDRGSSCSLWLPASFSLRSTMPMREPAKASAACLAAAAPAPKPAPLQALQAATTPVAAAMTGLSPPPPTEVAAFRSTAAWAIALSPRIRIMKIAPNRLRGRQHRPQLSQPRHRLRPPLPWQPQRPR